MIMLTDVQRKIESFYAFVAKGRDRDPGLVFQDRLSAEDPLSSIFQPALAERLAQIGYGFVPFYLHRYKRDEYHLRFVIARTVKSILLPEADYRVVHFIEKPREITGHAVFTIPCENQFFSSHFPAPVVFLDDALLPAALRESETALLSLITHRAGFRQTLNRHLEALTCFNCIDRLLDSRLLCGYSWYLLDQYERRARQPQEGLEFLKRGKDRAGLPAFMAVQSDQKQGTVSFDMIHKKAQTILNKMRVKLHPESAETGLDDFILVGYKELLGNFLEYDSHFSLFSQHLVRKIVQENSARVNDLKRLLHQP